MLIIDPPAIAGGTDLAQVGRALGSVVVHFSESCHNFPDKLPPRF